VNDVSKLIAALTDLTKRLGEAAGIPKDIVSSFNDQKAEAAGETRFNKDNTKILPGSKNLTSKDKAKSIFLGEVIGKTIYNLTNKDEKPDFGFKQVTEKVIPKGAQIQKDSDGEKAEKAGGFLSKIIPVLALAGGIAAAVMALFAGANPLGNILNISSKVLLKIAQNAITKIGDKLIKFSKAIGDDVAGTLTKLVDDVVGLPAKVAGMIKEKAAGFMDNLSGAAGKGLDKITKGGKFITMLKGIAKTVGATLLKFARFLPYIGSAVSFYFAYQKFKAGDTIGGALELVSGLVNLIPGFGWIASIAIDLFTIGRDIKMTEEERVTQSGGFSKGLAIAKDFLVKSFNKYIKYIPGIGGLVQAGMGIGKVFSGDIKGGLFEILKGIGNIVPGLGDTLFLGFEFLMDLISGDNSTDPETGRKLNFKERIFNFINEKMDKLPWYIRKPLELLGIIKKGESDVSEAIPGDIDNEAVINQEVKKINDKLVDTLGNTGSGFVDGINVDTASPVTSINSQIDTAAKKASDQIDMISPVTGLNSQIDTAAKKASDQIDMISPVTGLNSQIAAEAKKASDQVDMISPTKAFNSQINTAAKKASDQVDMISPVKAINSQIAAAASKANNQLQSSTNEAIDNLYKFENIDTSAVNVNVEPPKIMPPTVDVKIDSDQGQVIKSNNKIVDESVANRRVLEEQTRILKTIADNSGKQTNNNNNTPSFAGVTPNNKTSTDPGNWQFTEEGPFLSNLR
jgi:hypothetical protein